MIDERDKQRFMLSFTPVTECGCWLWDKSTDDKGYGFFWDNSVKRMSRAHRVSHQIHIGPIPEGLLVLHRCDTPSCVNPAHLFLGTNDDNMADKFRKGRQHHPCGSKNGKAKLNADDVLAIRLEYSTGKTTIVNLADSFGVGFTAISKIINRTTWKHI